MRQRFHGSSSPSRSSGGGGAIVRPGGIVVLIDPEPRVLGTSRVSVQAPAATASRCRHNPRNPILRGAAAAFAEHRWPVPAAPASASREDAKAGERRDDGECEGPQEGHAGAAREARDAERIERVPVLRNEPSLDPIRRPGERHFHPARAQGFGYRQRRGDVPHCSAGRDQAPQLSVFRHGHGRC